MSGSCHCVRRGRKGAGEEARVEGGGRDSVEPQRWLITEGLRMFRKCCAGGVERPPSRAFGVRASSGEDARVARGREGEG